MKRATLVLLLGIAFTPPFHSALAQQVEPGQRLRLSVPSLRPGWMTGQLSARDSATLSLRVEGDSVDTVVRLDAIERLERGTTVDKADAPVLAWGLIAAAAIGGASWGASEEACNTDLEHVLCGIGGAVLFNLGLGLAIGPIWPTHSEEDWEFVPLPADQP